MGIDFLSTIDNPPDGFRKMFPAKKDLLRGNVVLLLNCYDELFPVVNDFQNRVRGIIVTGGNEISCRKSGRMLWYMTAPESLFPQLHGILSGFMDLFFVGEKLFEENAMLREEFKLLKYSLASTRDDYNQTNKRLRMRVEQAGELNRKLQEQVIQLTELEQTLRESERSLKHAQQIARVGSWEWDMENDVFDMSEEMKNICGFKGSSPHNNIFKIIDKVVFHKDRERVAEFFIKLHTSGKMEEMFYRIHPADNEQEIRWIYAMPPHVKTYDKEGKPEVFIGTIQDITERKLAEDELRHLRNLLSNIVNSMPSILVGVDKQGKVIQWNLKAEQISGVKAENAKGKPLESILPQLKNEMEKIFRAIKSRQVQEKTKVVWKENGETRYEDITIYPLVTNGVNGAVIRVDDITERVRLEEIMIQSEKMLSVGGLAAGMAHEINNPLAGMMQNISVVINRLSKDLPPNRAAAEEVGISLESITKYIEKREILRILQNVNESGRRAAKIVRNMLSFARMSESRYSYCDLAELMDQTLELANSDYDLKKKYDFRKIDIVKEYAADLPEIACEGSKLQQVFLNILKNGAEAMALSRKEEKEKSRFIIRIQPDGDMVRIELEDNGPGMTVDEKKRIFEPFFTTKPVGIGTGLGLSVSYFIITENHGGTMTVRSASGEGTVFVIRIPIRRINMA